MFVQLEQKVSLSYLNYLKATRVAYLERYKEILQRPRVLGQLAEQDVSA